ncbi:MAG: MmoB/DmpM family protein [Actinomycetales bacterium]
MAEARTRPARPASVDIQDTEANRPLIEAIEEDNPAADTLRMPGLVKIRTDGRLVINRETVEKHMGREWETLEFQLAIVSMSGNLDIEEDEIVVGWRR